MSLQQQQQQQQQTKKSTDRVVFVRFRPPYCPNLRRHAVTAVCSAIGPIHKTHLIHATSNNNNNKSYGFVKFLSQHDADRAVVELKESRIEISPTESVTMILQAADKAGRKRASTASTAATTAATAATSTPATTATTPATTTDSTTDSAATRKKQARVILRNLNFRTTERHIRQALQAEGWGDDTTVVDVHVPTVGHPQQSRGFGFVTFQTVQQAQAACQRGSIIIQKRTVTIHMAVNKTEHQKRQQQAKTEHDRPGVETSAKGDGGDGDDDDEKKDPSEASDDEKADPEEDRDGDDDDDQSSSSRASAVDASSQSHQHSNQAMQERRALFLRNLPFDATRHQIFELLRTFGRIEAIYLVTDKTTGLFKGTAFVTYQNSPAATKAWQAGQDHTLMLQNRTLLMDYAVDSQTAATLTASSATANHKIRSDKRHLYLQYEGRVSREEQQDSNLSWDVLPESDQLKRQRAWSDKTTKLKSPMFYINPTRLSIRNIAKHVTDGQLKELCVTAVQRELPRVKVEDQVAHWKAQGVPSREILQRIQEASDNTIIPKFDDRNIKRYIPSVFLDQDLTKSPPVSRGFGFVEFTHHAHALACLRELNNNPRYSAEYCNGGKHAAGKKRSKEAPKVPRLMVEFAVENQVKAKQQLEHRTQQAANYRKQKEESSSKPKNQKKSRGKLQRERKRKEREGEVDPGDDLVSTHQQQVTGETTEETRSLQQQEPDAPGIRGKPTVNPPKKKSKVDEEEAKFTRLVESYKQSFEGASGPQKDSKKDRRWFD